MVAAIHALFVEEMASGRWAARDRVDEILADIDERYRAVDEPDRWGETPEAARGMAAAMELTRQLKADGDS